MKYKFLNKINDVTYFVGTLMEIYIPKEFLENKIATYRGDMIDTLGLFQFIVYEDENRLPSASEIHSMTLPMNIMFQYQDHYSAKDIQGKFKGRYEVFVLKHGDIFVDTCKKEKSANSTKNFVFRLHAGKIPNNIEYDKVAEIYLDSLQLNKVNLGNPSCIYELSIAELYRDKDDENIPFRHVLNRNPNLSMLDYQAINVKDLPAIKGTFQALMFENIKQSIHYSLLKTKNNDDETESPLEKVIHY